jgi:hypothetical protein
LWKPRVGVKIVPFDFTESALANQFLEDKEKLVPYLRVMLRVFLIPPWIFAPLILTVNKAILCWVKHIDLCVL